MKTVLWFSGGKDSMACLYMFREQLGEIAVLWANTGKNYPELLDTVAKAKLMCPHWHEINTDRDGQWSKNGMPSDVVPIDWTVLGQQLSGKKTITIQSYLGCCYENITGPLMLKTKELGATTIIKGQRYDEHHKSPARDGDIVDGIRFLHPIEGWSRADVLNYLNEQMGELPGHYSLDHSSMDCFDCTAFAAHSHDRAEYTKTNYPNLYAEYIGNINAVSGAIEAVFSEYQRIRTTPCSPA